MHGCLSSYHSQLLYKTHLQQALLECTNPKLGARELPDLDNLRGQRTEMTGSFGLQLPTDQGQGVRGSQLILKDTPACAGSEVTTELTLHKLHNSGR